MRFLQTIRLLIMIAVALCMLSYYGKKAGADSWVQSAAPHWMAAVERTAERFSHADVLMPDVG